MTNILCFCDKRPDDGIDVYKDFVQLMRRKEFEEPYILVTEGTTQKLKEYVRLLLDIKLVDGHYHVYFGQVKNLINSFLNFHISIMDDVIKESDKYTNESDKDDLLFLVEYTISVHQTKQVNFGKEFLPVNTLWEKRTYNEIEALYEDYIRKLQDIKDYINIRLDRRPKVYQFAKAHFEITARKMSETFDTAHLFMGMLLAERVRQTRLSLEEILRRLRNNLTSNRQEREKTMYQLITDLYERNKESMVATRFDKTNSALELAEANRSIDVLRSKIANYEIEVPAIARLEEEVAYWATKVDYFNEIANNLDLLKKQQEDTDKQQKEYHLLKCKQLVECRRDCKRMFRVLFSQRMEDIRLRIINETRALVTFFAVRGTDHILYMDNVGPYYVDEFNHMNYVFDYGLGIFHLDCDGKFVKHIDEDPYLFDKFGRYIVKDGEKLYQCAACTSKYKLNATNNFDKVTKDCGHSENIKKKCHMEISDLTKVEILPGLEPMDIRNTLPTETVRYLWDCFGKILPNALYDVGKTRPKNPIHFLAHKLLYNRHRMTTSEIEQNKEEAGKYREKIFKDRKERAEAATSIWRSRQEKRRKPEEADDSETRAHYAAKVSEELFILSLNQDY